MFFLALALILYLLVHGLMMILVPGEWFQIVPGVAETGGFNPHFIRDIGFAFFFSGSGIAWRLLDPVRGKAAALFSAGFLTLHAAYHLFETIVSSHHQAYIFADLAGVYLPAAAACVIASKQNIPLPMWFQRIGKNAAHIGIDKFAQTFRYDAGYMHDIAEVDLEAISRFSLLEEFGSYRKQISLSGWYAAKLAGCISEDCGPCIQLVVTMAEREGVSSSVLTALIAGECQQLDDEAQLFYAYAQAVLDHDVELETFREKILNTYGESAVVSAGIALITGKAYPLMKYATGHGQTCGKVRVSGQDIVVNKTLPITTGSVV